MKEKNDGLGKTVCWLLVSCCFSFLGQAQPEEPDYDTTYVESHYQRLVISLSAIYNKHDIGLADRDQRKLIYSTNLPLRAAISLDHKWFTLEYSPASFGPLNRSSGETQSTSFGFGYSGRKIWFRNFWRRQKGYYLEPATYTDDIGDLPDVIFRPDIQTTTFLASVNYGFNHREFSNMAALWQLEKQKKSAGSFTAGLMVASVSFKASSPLILPQWEGNFSPASFITSYRIKLVGANFGYLHTFAFLKSKRLFFSTGLVPGVCYQFGSVYNQKENASSHKSKLGYQAEGRVIFGYNHKSWYATFSTVTYQVSNVFNEQNPTFQNYTFNRIMFGYKFRVTKADREAYRKAKENLKFP